MGWEAGGGRGVKLGHHHHHRLRAHISKFTKEHNMGDIIASTNGMIRQQGGSGEG